MFVVLYLYFTLYVSSDFCVRTSVGSSDFLRRRGLSSFFLASAMLIAEMFIVETNVQFNFKVTTRLTGELQVGRCGAVGRWSSATSETLALGGLLLHVQVRVGRGLRRQDGHLGKRGSFCPNISQGRQQYIQLGACYLLLLLTLSSMIATWSTSGFSRAMRIVYYQRS